MLAGATKKKIIIIIIIITAHVFLAGLLLYALSIFISKMRDIDETIQDQDVSSLFRRTAVGWHIVFYFLSKVKFRPGFKCERENEKATFSIRLRLHFFKIFFNFEVFFRLSPIPSRPKVENTSRS